MFRKARAKEGMKRVGRGEVGRETSSLRLYLHKIVVVDAFEDNEMKLNK